MVPKRQAAKTGTQDGAVPKRRRVKVKPGQVVGVPLRDGTFALAHIALRPYLSMTCVLFAHNAATAEQLLEGLDEVLRGRPIAVMVVTSDEARSGSWPVIAERDPAYPAELLDTRGVSHTASLARMVFEAYYGLRPWDELYDPKGYEKMLLPGVPVPPTVRYKRDFERDAAAVAAKAAAADEPALQVTEGPGEIHIEITYPGEGLPPVELLHRRQKLESALEAAGAGEVTDAGGGGGVMDIFLQTDDVARALPLVKAAVKEAGFDKDARIEAAPLDEDEEEEDE
jgi:hypothetical protein